jgi:hypothetical protein
MVEVVFPSSSVAVGDEAAEAHGTLLQLLLLLPFRLDQVMLMLVQVVAAVKTQEMGKECTKRPKTNDKCTIAQLC